MISGAWYHTSYGRAAGLAAGERDGRLHVVVTFCASLLHAAAALGAVCARVLDVDRCGDDLDVSERELFSAVITQPS